MSFRASPLLRATTYFGFYGWGCLWVRSAWLGAALWTPAPTRQSAETFVGGAFVRAALVATGALLVDVYLWGWRRRSQERA